MGRLMVAKSIQAFMSFENMTDQLKILINQEILKSSSFLKKNHNFAHGILLQIYHVLCNYLKVRKDIVISNVILLNSYFLNNFRKILNCSRKKFYKSF